MKVFLKKLLEFTDNFLKKLLIKHYRRLTAPIRVLPDFMIIGASKCGTTSLYNYLIKHPYITPAFKKEAKYFIFRYERGINYYKSFFPTKLKKWIFSKIYRRELITGEASPGYMFHPDVAKKVHSILPNIKAIIMLRNPVDRAYSHYYHGIRKGIEYYSFKKALEIENDRLKGDFEKLKSGEINESRDYRRYSYITRGIYVDQIINWLKFFPKEQVYIIKSEEFFKNPSKYTQEVFKFLGLPNWDYINYKKYNIGEYEELDEVTKKDLIEFYKPFNQRLYQLLEKDFGWDY